MDFNHFFASNYRDARDKFLLACGKKKLELEKHVHPLSADFETELATDVIYVGPANAGKLLVLTSGVHGPELMCGSGCQTGHLAAGDFDELPADVGVLIIHALNPWGAAKLRRNTEDNIDLARNFLDFSQPLPINAAYPELHGVLSEPCYETFQERSRDYIAKQGAEKFTAALMGGQYAYSDGFSYGGVEPTWSNRLFCQLLRQYGEQANKICHIDYHTAVGLYGYGMAVCMQTGSELDRAKRRFGNWIVAPRAKQSEANRGNYTVTGHPSDGVMKAFAGEQKDIVSVVLEFGTFDTFAINLPALLDDHWLTQYGDVGGAQGKQIKAQLLRVHCPDDPEWRYAVWNRSGQAIRQAFAGLRN